MKLQMGVDKGTADVKGSGSKDIIFKEEILGLKVLRGVAIKRPFLRRLISLSIVFVIAHTPLSVYAQANKKMNIADTIFQPSPVAAFITTEFDNYIHPKKVELFKQAHFLYTKNFNAAPRKNKEYTIGKFPRRLLG